MQIQALTAPVAELEARYRQVERPPAWRSRGGQISVRMTTPRGSVHAGYRYPAELISYAVWLYLRFPLSLRMVQEMLAARGISVTYETIRQWGLKFGREFANRLRRRAPRRGDKWHLRGRPPHRRQEALALARGRSGGLCSRRRERIMKRFKSPRQVQRFLSTHDQIANFFSRRRNQDTAAKCRGERAK